MHAYFYPRSPCGERRISTEAMTHDIHFYPRSPCGERRADIVCLLADADFYPRSPCGERRLPSTTTIIPLEISIHALLAESDLHL